MTIDEAREYCRLRAEGAGLFERNQQEAMKWYRMWEELENSSQHGYGPWPLEAVISGTKMEEG